MSASKSGDVGDYARCAAAVCLCFGLLGLFVGAAQVEAAHRFVRRFDETSGLAVATVTGVAQDREGFLWLGTHGGLVRFDGYSFDPWARDQVPGTVSNVVACPAGGVLVLSPRSGLLRSTEDGVEPVSGPGGAALMGVADAAYDGEGRLWVIQGGEVWMRDGRWQRPPRGVVGQYPAIYLSFLGSLMAVVTTKDIRVIDASDRLSQRIQISAAADIVCRADGSYIVLRLNGELLSVPPSAAGFEKILTLPAKGVALAARGDAVWAAFDRYLVRLGPHGAPDVMGLADGIPSGGRLLVDREGSLWMGTFSGLLQFPEPDTTIWSDLEGLPSAHARYVAPSGNGILVSTWQGLGLLSDEGGGWHASTLSMPVVGPLCPDRDRAVWFGDDEGLYRYQDGRADLVARGPASLRACSLGQTGLWLAGETGITVVRKGVPAMVERASEQSAPVAVDAVLETSSSELIWVAGTLICRQPVNAVLAGSSKGSVCWEQPEIEQALDLAQVGDELWLAGRGFGILRLGRRSAAPHPGVETLPSRVVFSLTRSPRGGVWIAGKGFLRRVLEASDERSGWRVVETLGPWQGVPGRSGGQVVELGDGQLWISTDNGLVHVLPTATTRPVPAPMVVIGEILRNGRPWERGTPLSLDWSARHLELRFAPLSFRDPTRVRYRSRVSHGKWSAASANPRLSLTGLAPGRYSVEVEASVDGHRWSARPAGLRFRVRPPWYRTWWALLLAMAAVAVILYVVRRMKLTSLAKVERERERIARDLHDQVGSGLASIGILASLSADEAVPIERRTRLAGDIGEVASRLNFTLRAIVWSLREPEAGLRDTVVQLSEHGARLFSQAREGLEVVMPDVWPRGNLPLLLRRNILLIGLEALHNAERHAHADGARLAVEEAGGGLWRLSIADDGIGFRAEDHQDRPQGLGLHNMSKRAEAIGGTLSVKSSTGSGTTITLLFGPWPVGILGRRGQE